MLQTALLIAQGRGDTPEGGVGVALIVGIAIAAVVLFFLAHWLVHRFGREKPDTHERRPHRAGRVGRISKQRGP